MAIDPKLGEINTAEFTREFEAEVKKIADRTAQQRAAKPQSPAVHYLFRQLGPSGGIPAAGASVLAHVIVELQERIAALEAAQAVSK
jgi:hypothetical protein